MMLLFFYLFLRYRIIVKPYYYYCSLVLLKYVIGIMYSYFIFTDGSSYIEQHPVFSVCYLHTRLRRRIFMYVHQI